jgi:hypothetical protein
MSLATRNLTTPSGPREYPATVYKLICVTPYQLLYPYYKPKSSLCQIVKDPSLDQGINQT